MVILLCELYCMRLLHQLFFTTTQHNLTRQTVTKLCKKGEQKIDYGDNANVALHKDIIFVRQPLFQDY